MRTNIPFPLTQKRYESLRRNNLMLIVGLFSCTSPVYYSMGMTTSVHVLKNAQATLGDTIFLNSFPQFGQAYVFFESTFPPIAQTIKIKLIVIITANHQGIGIYTCSPLTLKVILISLNTYIKINKRRDVIIPPFIISLRKLYKHGLCYICHLVHTAYAGYAVGIIPPGVNPTVFIYSKGVTAGND